MSKNSTIYYSMHKLDEESEEDYVIDLDELMGRNTSSFQEVYNVLDTCHFSVSDTVIQDILDYSRSYSRIL